MVGRGKRSGSLGYTWQRGPRILMVARSRGNGYEMRWCAAPERGETGPARTARGTGTDERGSAAERRRVTEMERRVAVNAGERANGRRKGVQKKGGKKRQVRVEGEIYRQRSESTATGERIQGEKKREREMWSQEAVEVEEE